MAEAALRMAEAAFRMAEAIPEPVEGSPQPVLLLSRDNLKAARLYPSGGNAGFIDLLKP